MSELLKSIDARTKLAGTNKLEILLFTLGTNARTGRRETFGINVFKVREVMRTPPITGAPEMLVAEMGGLVTAVTELADGRLVMMMDVEKVLSETTNYDEEAVYRNIKPLNKPDLTVFFADDSIVARKQIMRTLDAMHVKYNGSINGREAWNELEKIAAFAQASGQAVTDLVSLVLTDVEMPEMDGYILTKRIKSDPRFAGVPVIMHSSLSGMSNQQLGQSVGVDEYVAKFEPQKLSETLARRLLGAEPVARVES